MFFSKKVNKSSKKSLVEFLTRHFRYNTMRSWNNAASFAHCVKLNRLGLSSAQVDVAYDMLQTDFWDEIRYPIDDFTSEMNGRYTIGTNGRSGGYLVLYQSQYEPTEHQSYCRACGQRNFKLVESTNGNRCGKCGAEGEQGRVNFTTPPKKLSVYPGKGFDHGEDYSEWSISELRSRVELVQRFDQACDEIRDNFIELLDNNKVVEEIVMIPKTVKRIQSIHQ